MTDLLTIVEQPLAEGTSLDDELDRAGSIGASRLGSFVSLAGQRALHVYRGAVNDSRDVVAWTGRSYLGMSQRQPVLPDHGASVVVVERTFPDPQPYADILAGEEERASCMRAYQVEHLDSFVRTDDRGTVCLYRARDAETVRIANRLARLDFVRAWTATYYPAR